MCEGDLWARCLYAENKESLGAKCRRSLVALYIIDITLYIHPLFWKLLADSDKIFSDIIWKGYCSFATRNRFRALYKLVDKMFCLVSKETSCYRRSSPRVLTVRKTTAVAVWWAQLTNTENTKRAISFDGEQLIASKINRRILISKTARSNGCYEINKIFSRPVSLINGFSAITYAKWAVDMLISDLTWCIEGVNIHYFEGKIILLSAKCLFLSYMRLWVMCWG